jgi:hypothetical protein
MDPLGGMMVELVDRDQGYAMGLNSAYLSLLG